MAHRGGRAGPVRWHVPEPGLHPVEDAGATPRTLPRRSGTPAGSAIGARWTGADWPAIRDRVFGRIDPLHERAVAHRRENGIDVFGGEARFAAPKVLQVGEDEIARAIVSCSPPGSRPAIPPIDGLADVPVSHVGHGDAARAAAEVDGGAGRRVHRGGDEPHFRLARHRRDHRDPRRAPAAPARRRHPGPVHRPVPEPVRRAAGRNGRASVGGTARGSASTWRVPQAPRQPRARCCW